MNKAREWHCQTIFAEREEEKCTGEISYLKKTKNNSVTIQSHSVPNVILYVFHKKVEFVFIFYNFDLLIRCLSKKSLEIYKSLFYK